MLDTEDSHSEDPVEVEVCPITRIVLHFEQVKVILFIQHKTRQLVLRAVIERNV